MKQGIILIIIGILLIAGGFFLYYKFKPKEYYCGHSSFGGLVGGSSPDDCSREWEIIMRYKPLCEELAAAHSLYWEDVCRMVLQTPGAICSQNLAELKVNLSEEEKEKCFQKVSIISGISVETLKEIEGESW